MAKRKTNPDRTNGTTIGYEAELWRMADALRGSMDAAEYKHVVLGLIFLKYISDAFDELHEKLEGECLPENKRWKYGVPPAGNAVAVVKFYVAGGSGF